MRILFIHGRAQEQFNEEELKVQWSNALALSFADAGIQYPGDLKIDFIYYAKELVGQKELYLEAMNNGQHVFRGGRVVSKELKFLEDFAEDLADNAKIDKRAAIAEFGGDTIHRGMGNNIIATTLLRAVDKYVPGFSNHSIGSFTPDVASYLIVPNVRESINKLVTSAITEEPTIIIAHSLGTIIAYNVLQAIENSPCDIKMLITLGSPLGVRSVKRQLLGRLKHPRILKGTWHNIYDPMDIVSLNPLDEKHFNVSPKIVNYPMKNTSDNRHGISQYLSFPKIAELIMECLGSSQR